MHQEEEPKRIDRSEFDWLVACQVQYILSEISDLYDTINRLQNMVVMIDAAKASGKIVKLYAEDGQVSYEVESKPKLGFKGVQRE